MLLDIVIVVTKENIQMRMGQQQQNKANSIHFKVIRVILR